MTATRPVGEGLILVSILACPACGAARAETMPLDVCVWRHPCAACGADIRAPAGRCCVYCAFGSIPCPPVQLERKGDHP